MALSDEGYSRWEANSSHDSCRAWLVGEVQGLGITGVDILQTGESKLSEPLSLFVGSSIDVADEHAEALSMSVTRHHLCLDGSLLA